MMLNNQEIFNLVIEGIFKQGGPSYTICGNGYRKCKYRGEDGRKCVVGIILPDEIYEPSMEGRYILHHEWFSKNLETIHFLLELQKLHDHVVDDINDRAFDYEISKQKFDELFLEKFKCIAIDLAKEWDLTTTGNDNGG